MKKSLLALALLAFFTTGYAAETKKVCVDKTTKDGKVVKGKDGKPEQVCKTIKVHKKLEVEPVKK